jgi:penicillin-binding protein 1B
VSLVVVPPLLAVTGVLTWWVYQDVSHTLERKFAGRRWDFPSKVYSDSYSLYPGLTLDTASFRRRLKRRGYREVGGTPQERGEFHWTKEPPGLELRLNTFQYPTHREPGRSIRIDLDDEGRISGMYEMPDDTQIYELMLEPVVITGLHGALLEERHEMPLAGIPVPLVRAVIAVEDRRFLKHGGIDWRGLARAMLVNLRAGRVVQGGSTLTQQLMKNFFLTEDRTISRKVREAIMALVAEHRYSKTEILENYMNEIYLGQKGAIGIHGMWEAASYYFGKEPRELTLGQIALLAGMIRAPNFYDPHQHPVRAVQRRNVVLGVLLRTGEIDQRTYDAAVAEPLATVPPPPKAEGAPYFVNYVRRELADNFPSSVLATEGYQIFTTLDLELQEIAEDAVKRGVERIEEEKPELANTNPEDKLQAALIATNPSTGAIVAMVGGRDFQESQFNRAVDARRQPGSVFKPIVYLAALSSEWPRRAHRLPTSVVLDEPFTWDYDGGSWSPANYDDQYFGQVTVREALEHSLNTATARIARDVGIDSIRRFAIRLGMRGDLPPYPAIALGGWEASPLEIAHVYGVFANEGMSAAPRAVSKVVDRNGHVVEGNPLEIKRVLSPRDAFMITYLLEGVMEHGTGHWSREQGFTRPAAGKTGTTNDFHDAWFAGYTPDLLSTVWVGFDRGEDLGLSGAKAALPIWTVFMQRALAGQPATDFRVPSGIVLVDVDPLSGQLAVPGCPEVVHEAFLAGEEPVDTCELHGGSGH